MLIQVKNFQGVKNAKVLMKEGITSITGKTNNGKSSILRAIISLLYNSSTESDIRVGEESLIVAIKNNGHIVKYRRRYSGNFKVSYDVDNSPIEKVGRALVEEVECLGISADEYGRNIHIIEQEDSFFLINESPNKVYEFLSQNKSELLLETLDNMQFRFKELKSDIKVKSGIVDNLKTRYSEIKDELIRRPLIKDNYAVHEKHVEIKSMINNANILTKKYHDFKNQLKEMDKEISHLLELGKNVDKINKITNIVPTNLNTKSLNNTFSAILQLESDLRDLDKKEDLINMNSINVDLDKVLEVSKIPNVEAYIDMNKKLEVINKIADIEYPKLNLIDLSFISKAKSLQSSYVEELSKDSLLEDYHDITYKRLESNKKELMDKLVCPRDNSQCEVLKMVL